MPVSNHPKTMTLNMDKLRPRGLGMIHRDTTNEHKCHVVDDNSAVSAPWVGDKVDLKGASVPACSKLSFVSFACAARVPRAALDLDARTFRLKREIWSGLLSCHFMPHGTSHEAEERLAPSLLARCAPLEPYSSQVLK